ncbi:hypothetical protein [Sphingomonas gellani]|nr:hypothetical protein [Sphingomonas gellani]
MGPRTLQEAWPHAYGCGEFSLTALACNLRQAINLVGVQGLIRAVQA